MKPEIYVRAGAIQLGSVQDTAHLLSASGSHSLVVKADGSALAFGKGKEGQLGNGNANDSATPVAVSGASNLSAVAGGQSHSLALTSSGAVLSWGSNADGRLGVAGAGRNVAGAVSGLSDAREIAAGRDHSLALLQDGTVWAWGSNSTGQLGNGLSGGKSELPLKVVGLPQVADIAAGLFHNLALTADGAVWAWGRNSSGQLGDGTTTKQVRPVQVTGLPGEIMAVAAGESFSMALASDGTVWAWGSNAFGQVGNGAAAAQTSPRQVPALSGIKEIAAGARHALALKGDGTVFAWGYNYYGQLGNGGTADSGEPRAVSGLADVAAIRASGGMHSFAVKNDGSVWGWGANDLGQLGLGDTSNRTTPALIPGLIIKPASRPAPADYTFGAQVEGTTSAEVEFTVENWGTGNLKLTGKPFVKIEGPNAADFRIVSMPSSPIGKGEQSKFKIVFEPKSAGEKSATVVIASNDLDDPQYKFGLKGTATAKVQPKPPKLVVKQYYAYSNIYEVPIQNGDVVTFKEYKPGEKFAALCYYIENHGESDLRLDGATLSDTMTFKLTDDVGSPEGRAPQFPVVLPPGGRKILFVVYAPKTAGPHTTTLQLRTSDPAQPLHQFTITVPAVQMPPKMVIKQYYSYTNIYEVPIRNGDVVDFREYRPGEPFTSLSYYIENHGQGDLRLEGASLGDNYTFKITDDVGSPQGRTPAFPLVIPPGGRKILFVVYHPKSNGPHSTTMQVRSSDPALSSVSWTINIPATQQPGGYGGGGYGGGGYGGGGGAGSLVVKQYYSYSSIYDVPVRNGELMVCREPRPWEPYQTLCFYIENSGQGTLQLNGLQVSNPALFIAVVNHGVPDGPRPSFPVSIPPGGRWILYLVCMRQGRPGPLATSVSMQTSDPANAQFAWNVQIP